MRRNPDGAGSRFSTDFARTHRPIPRRVEAETEHADDRLHEQQNAHSRRY
jgi:hypothetical protein